MDDFREILRELITASGLSLRALAAASGVTATQYSRYLHDDIPTLPIVLKIAVYFDCSLDYLFGLDEQRNRGGYQTAGYDLTDWVARYQKLLADNHTTHQQFATANHWHRTIINHWRQGKAPRLDVLFTIAKNLNASIDELVGRE